MVSIKVVEGIPSLHISNCHDTFVSGIATQCKTKQRRNYSAHSWVLGSRRFGQHRRTCGHNGDLHAINYSFCVLGRRRFGIAYHET